MSVSEFGTLSGKPKHCNNDVKKRVNNELFWLGIGNAINRN